MDETQFGSFCSTVEADLAALSVPSGGNSANPATSFELFSNGQFTGWNWPR